MDKEGGIGTYSSPNESLDRVKEERGQVIGRSSTLFVSGNRDKEISFEDRGHRERTRDLMPNSGRRSRAGVSGQHLA